VISGCHNRKDFVGIKTNIILKINLRYFQVSLGYSIGPLNGLRSKRGGLKFLVDKEK